MKTRTKTFNLKLVFALIAFGFAIQFTNAQVKNTLENPKNLTITGQVSDDEGLLPGTSIILKGTNIGVVSDENGKYTFPKPLAIGDVLLFSYLGYEKKEVKLNGKTLVINPVLELESTEIVLTALDSGLPYKTKR
tara:strand:+ start:704 stop:1108 length:405 start_codon:yes stop_codon:yes gene_type:complete